MIQYICGFQVSGWGIEVGIRKEKKKNEKYRNGKVDKVYKENGIGTNTFGKIPVSFSFHRLQFWKVFSFFKLTFFFPFSVFFSSSSSSRKYFEQNEVSGFLN